MAELHVIRRGIESLVGQGSNELVAVATEVLSGYVPGSCGAHKGFCNFRCCPFLRGADGSLTSSVAGSGVADDASSAVVEKARDRRPRTVGFVSVCR